MIQTFEIQGRLPSLNKITNSNRTCWATGAKQKREAQDKVVQAIKDANIKPFDNTVSGTILIVMSDRRQDRDNLEAGAKKVILDALQVAGTIRSDGWKHALEFPARCIYGHDERIVVIISDEERMTDYIPYWTQEDSDDWKWNESN